MVSVLSLVTTPIRPATAMPAAMICSAIAASIVAPHAVARAMTPSHVERSVSRLRMYLNMPEGACQKELATTSGHDTICSMENISITSAYSITNNGQQINGTIPVYGAIGYCKVTLNGVDLYVLHTSVTKDSFESGKGLQFNIEGSNPVINRTQLESLKRQLDAGKKDLYIRGLLTQEEGEALIEVERIKRKLDMTHTPQVLYICAR